jgi:hypothetical protein
MQRATRANSCAIVAQEVLLNSSSSVRSYALQFGLMSEGGLL